ncbi:MAG: hypothetical protein RLZZ223_236 [Candidatus Parcubacteria bacterium]|jgi:hypothetical protein
MSEFYRPIQEEPEDKEEFEHQLADASNQTEVDRLIKDKAHDILTEISAKKILEDLKVEIQEDLRYRVEKAINPSINVDIKFDSNDAYIAINELREDIPDLDTTELIHILLNRVNEEISTIPEKLNIIEKSARLMKNSESIKTQLLNLQNELTMLKQQLESQLDNSLELEGTPIQNALDQYRRFRSKLESLPEDSLERDDIERVLAIYAEYIKQGFEQSPEKYSIGTSQPLSFDVEQIIDEFIEPNDLTNEQKYHQRDIAESRQNITKKLSETPGVVAVIPIPEGTQGSKIFDIIAITLKPDNNLSTDEINIALKLLYAQIQDSANSKQDLIEDNRLDLGNIEIYTNGKPLSDYRVDSQFDSEFNPSQIFQIHRIKVAKRSTDFKYKDEYTEHSMAMARPSHNLEDNNNIPTLSNSYTTQEETHLTYTPFNQAMFQLSAQRALGLDLT